MTTMTEVFHRVRLLGSVRVLESLTPRSEQEREAIVSCAVRILASKVKTDFTPSAAITQVISPQELSRILGEFIEAPNVKASNDVTVCPQYIKISRVERQTANGGNYETVTVEVNKFSMSLISFASLDQHVYVSFVAKDEDGGNRGCYVLECEDHEHADRMYKAIEQTFSEPGTKPVPINIPTLKMNSRAWDDTLPNQKKSPGHPNIFLQNKEPIYQNQVFLDNQLQQRQPPPPIPQPMPQPKPRKSIIKASQPQGFSNYVNHESIVKATQEKQPSQSSVDDDSIYQNPHAPPDLPPRPQGYSRIETLNRIVDAARGLPYYHDFRLERNRREAAEAELIAANVNGGFLLRDSSTEFIVPNRIHNITLSVLNFTNTGRRICQHVLMLDKDLSKALVRTQEKEFQTIDELINYYLPPDRVLHLPSETGELNISTPIEVKTNSSFYINTQQHSNAKNVYV